MLDDSLHADRSNKRCSCCKQVKPASEFNQRKRSADGLQTICKVCSRARSRKYYADNRAEHSKATTARNRRWKAEIRRRILAFLAEHPCVDCGCSDIRVLEFDHLGDKEHGICEMIRAALSWDRIEREISKCEVRCANCHRIRSFRDRPCYRSIELAALETLS
jgi:hypothetical protein